VLRIDPATAQTTPWEPVHLTFNPDDFRVEQVFYPSKDGTKVPMFIVRRKDAKGRCPRCSMAMAGSILR
jgi:prolyl oligopeptidase